MATQRALLPLVQRLHMRYVGPAGLTVDARQIRMNAVHKKSRQRDPTQKDGVTPATLDAPWWIHAHVWVFMVTLGVSPLLFLAMREPIESRDWLAVLITVVLIQGFLWIAQRRCSSEDLTYWEGLLVVAASVTVGGGPIALLLSFPLLLFTVTASLLFALLHDATSPTRHASLCFGRMIIAIHKRRLYRIRK
jgi:hypothetical protein